MTHKKPGRPVKSYKYAGMPIREFEKITRRLSEEEELRLKLALLKDKPVKVPQRPKHISIAPEVFAKLKTIKEDRGESYSETINWLVERYHE